MDVAEMRRDMKKEGGLCQFGLCGSPDTSKTYNGNVVCQKHYDMLTDDEDVDFRSLRDTLREIFPDRDSPDHPFSDMTPNDPDPPSDDSGTGPEPPEDAEEYAEITLWRDYERQKVGVETDDMGRQLLHPDKARQLAISLLDRFGDDTEEIVTDLKRFADDVESRNSGGD
jgi:hypothetical protein